MPEQQSYQQTDTNSSPISQEPLHQANTTVEGSNETTNQNWADGSSANTPKRRKGIAWMTHIGLFLLFAIRGSYTTAVFNQKNSNGTLVSTILNNTKIQWTESSAMVHDSLYLTAILLGQAVCGVALNYFTGHTLLLVSVGFAATLNAFSTMPIFGVAILIGIRILQGFLTGVSIPAVFRTLSWWCPSKERYEVTVFCLCGVLMELGFGPRLTSFLAEVVDWTFPAHAFLLLSMIWCLCWFFFGSEKPSGILSPDNKELEYIEKYRSPQPCQNQISSWDLWPVLLLSVTRSLVIFVMILYAPIYIPHTFFITKIHQWPIVTAFCMLVLCIPLIGVNPRDPLKEKKANTACIRGLTAVAHFAALALFMSITAAKDDYAAIVFLFALVNIISFLGFTAMCADLIEACPWCAPRHVAFLGAFVGNWADFISPMLDKDLDGREAKPWQYVFMGVGLLHLVGIILYATHSPRSKPYVVGA